MKISFHGAARTVTGSKHILHLKNGTNILLDCGMFQGLGNQTDELNRNFGFSPTDISFLILSHAHIDHCGLIPKLVKEGFKGKIYCTPATKDLTTILLEDSAIVQRDDNKFINKRRAKEGLPAIEPIYNVKDVEACLKLFETIDYGQWATIAPGIDLLFTDAGHIIGSAVINLKIIENGKAINLSFSGDVGRYRDIILRSPDTFPAADYIILESTYGNKIHESAQTTPDTLLNWIQKTCIDKKGKLIIPAFSVGRTQELLYTLNQLELENRLPHIPIFVDSPLSREATYIVKSHPENFNTRIKKTLEIDTDPFDFKGLKYIKTADESKQLNFFHQPCIIISASGMADAGRVKHHIANNIDNAKNTILLVGYCEPNSLGGKLINGEKEVKIYGELHKVFAEIGKMDSMSAHGDYDDLCQFLACQHPESVKTIFLVHGEEEVQIEFKQRLLKKGFKDVVIPKMHETVKID